MIIIYFFSSYLPRIPQKLVVEGHCYGIDNARPAIETFSSKDAIDLLLFLTKLSLFLLHTCVSSLFISLVVPDVQGIHQ